MPVNYNYFYQQLRQFTRMTALLLCRLQPGHRQDGGAKRDRTADLLRARQALSQLSYGPIVRWWWV